MSGNLAQRIRQELRARPGAAVAVAFVVALIVGYTLGGGSEGQQPRVVSEPARRDVVHAELYTCSMHPHIIRDEPGQCPICGMDLVPVEAAPAGDEIPADALRLSAHAAALAQVETSLVERRAVVADMRLIGTIDYDETRVRTVSAWLPGRIDRLFVDYVGVAVKEGDHLGLIYGPELLASQQDLMEAARALRRAQKNTPALVAPARSNLESTRERFRLWGFTSAQILQIERQDQPSDHMTIFSPSSGVVIERAVDEGSYVREGDKLLRIADLSQVWLVMAAYESDLPWIRYGQSIEFEVPALPGEHFEGRIAFVSPMVDPVTRTTQVRANLDNRAGHLKPDMFARARVKVHLGVDGAVVEPALAGKWVGTMHPEIVRDEPGPCPICGMPLVQAESLGHAVNPGLPLVIPATAPLITGDRAVVYVAHFQAAGDSWYEGREVTLGPRAEDAYVVLDGLEEGERVVTRGAFKVDSSVQIQAKRSMMNPSGGAAPPAEHLH